MKSNRFDWISKFWEIKVKNGIIIFSNSFGGVVVRWDKVSSNQILCEKFLMRSLALGTWLAQIHLFTHLKVKMWTSLVVQWLSPPASVGTRFQSLIREDSTSLGTTKPMYRKYWSPHALSTCSVSREATTMKSACSATREWPLLSTTRKSPSAAMKTQPNIK